MYFEVRKLERFFKSSRVFLMQNTHKIHTRH
nr:MAG TPA: hypothetical protein [Caudoviricetes sp.]